MYFVGIDWGWFEHAVCIVLEDGSIYLQFTIKHNEDGISELRDRMDRLSREGTIRIGIERPNGVVVEALVNAGYEVVPFRPDSLKGFRSRYKSASAKDDRLDAYILADVLRTDGHRMQALKPQSPQTKVLFALTRTIDSLTKKRVRAVNKLEAFLGDFWPGAIGLFEDLHSRIALNFLKTYSTARAASNLSEADMATFLKGEKYSGKTSAAELLHRLKSAVQRESDPNEAEIKGEIIKAFVREIEVLVEERARLEKLLRCEYKKHPDAAILESLPCKGDLTAMKLLAEIGDQRDRFENAEHLVAVAGASPVTKSSGKYRDVVIRRACNKHLRVAVAVMAAQAITKCEYSRAKYAEARSRGKSHPAALRILARFWLRVIYPLWKNHELYDRAKHRAVQPPQKAA